MDAAPALYSPSAARNSGPITEVLRQWLPAQGRVLEVASGSGQHICEWARAFARISWQPSDVSERALQSVAWRVDAAQLTNAAAPVRVDLADPRWEIPLGVGWSGIVAVNVLHISPWEVSAGLFRGAGQCLISSGLLAIYGPFRIGGTHHAPTNAAFDEQLRAQDPAWGIRDVGELDDLAGEHGMGLVETIPMPSNNHTLVFRPEG